MLEIEHNSQISFRWTEIEGKANKRVENINWKRCAISFEIIKIQVNAVIQSDLTLLSFVLVGMKLCYITAQSNESTVKFPLSPALLEPMKMTLFEIDAQVFIWRVVAPILG